MTNRSREKVALLIFVLLLALGAFLIGSYIVGSHSLNVAATQINDTFGNMEGYSAIVFEGTQKPDDGAADASADAAAADVEEGAGRALRIEGAGGADGADGGSDAAGDARTVAEEAVPKASERERAALEIAARSTGLAKETSVETDEVVALYRDKGAHVFAIDATDFSRYADNVILKRGSTRIGVFSVTAMTSVPTIEKHVEYFADYHVDYVVALTPDPDYLKTKDGIDIVISTDAKDGSTLGRTVQGAYVVSTPEMGEVGVVLVSPSNVVSSKVVEEL